MKLFDDEHDNFFVRKYSELIVISIVSMNFSWKRNLKIDFGKIKHFGLNIENIIEKVESN